MHLLHGAIGLMETPVHGSGFGAGAVSHCCEFLTVTHYWILALVLTFLDLISCMICVVQSML